MTSSDSHDELRESLGAYVLGQLGPAEVDLVRTHLDTCAECRAELTELLPTVTALARVKAAPSADQAQVPSELRGKVEAAIHSEAVRVRRSKLVRTVGTTLVAASVAILMVLGVISLLDRTPAAPVPEAVAVTVSAGLDAVTASAGLIAHTWGTEVKLQTSGLEAGATYQAVVLGPGDRTFPAGTFTGTGPNTINCNLQTSVLREDARGFQIFDQDGEVVISSEF